VQTTRDGLTFDVVTGGPVDAPPVLLLHGFPQNARSWTAVAAMLHEAGLRTLAPDQRGYSPGARPSDVSAYAIGELVADALSFIDAAGVEELDVVGHDWGSIVGWHLAGRHPDRVRTFTAVSVPHPAAHGSAMMTDPDQQERSAYIRLLRSPEAGQALLADDAAWLREAFSGSGLSESAVETYVGPLRSPAALAGPLAWYRAMGRADFADLGPSPVPTTYVWSDGDRFVAPAAAEACGAYVTGDFSFVVLEGVTHWIPEQAAGDLAEQILRRVNG